MCELCSSWWSKKKNPSSCVNTFIVTVHVGKKGIPASILRLLCISFPFPAHILLICFFLTWKEQCCFSPSSFHMFFYVSILHAFSHPGKTTKTKQNWGEFRHVYPPLCMTQPFHMVCTRENVLSLIPLYISKWIREETDGRIGWRLLVRPVGDTF